MPRKTTYQAARSVAAAVEKHFASQVANLSQSGLDDRIPVPSASAVEQMLDVAFWASLRREEGHPPKISLAYIPPDMAGQSLLFEQRFPLSPLILLKLAPGVERAGIHLGVWQEQGELFIWGTTKDIKSFCFVLDVSEPGLLVVKHRRPDGYGKFVNVAVLLGDQVKLVDENTANLPDCPTLLTSLLDFRTSSWSNTVNVLVQLAVSMRAHKRGGSLLVVPAGTDNWRSSIIRPISYPVVPPYEGLAALMRLEDRRLNESSWQSELHREVESIAGFTAVDGATIISDQYDLLAFGAKIGRRDGQPPVQQISLTEPIIGGEARVLHPTQNGGTRHLSAAQFVHDQQDALALIASQDGRFTVFSWSPCEGMVHAHRIDTLLL